MAANIFEQLSEQLAVTANNAHQSGITYSGVVMRHQVEGLLTNPSNIMELLGNFPATAASLRSSQPPIQTNVG